MAISKIFKVYKYQNLPVVQYMKMTFRKRFEENNHIWHIVSCVIILFVNNCSSHMARITRCRTDTCTRTRTIYRAIDLAIKNE